jgi:hypothetical protein
MMPEPQLQYYETARMLVLRGSGGKRHQPRLAGAPVPLTDCNPTASHFNRNPDGEYVCLFFTITS